MYMEEDVNGGAGGEAGWLSVGDGVAGGCSTGKNNRICGKQKSSPFYVFDDFFILFLKALGFRK
jgi:hypothetical protein